MYHRVHNGSCTPASERGINRLFRGNWGERELDMQHNNFTALASEIEIVEINVSYIIHCPSKSALIY